MKKLVTIQDISCFGKCSLTAAIPVISAMGVETAVIPTAVLSTHTGKGFSGYTFRDLTDDIPAIAAHWKKLGLKFDAIYTGYIGSCEQVEVVKQFISDFRTDGTLVVVDPVMGDGGNMYPGFDTDFVESMKSLCSFADCILPNATETALLLGKDYNPDMTESEIIDSLHALTELGCETAVITGASCGENQNGAMAFSRSDGRVCKAFCENIDGSFHSTGDIFSSVVSGGMTLGMDLQTALDLAVSFTHYCIKATLPVRDEQWYAVRFEPCLGGLAAACQPYLD
jgi:pyridoxine kinase